MFRMRFGMHAMIQLGDLFPVGFAPAAIDDNELPIEIGFHATHSSFTCPILKEQCDAENPPMRLICGHVISKDAINRLTTSIRQQRNSSRYSLFSKSNLSNKNFQILLSSISQKPVDQQLAFTMISEKHFWIALRSR